MLEMLRASFMQIWPHSKSEIVLIGSTCVLVFVNHLANFCPDLLIEWSFLRNSNAKMLPSSKGIKIHSWLKNFSGPDFHPALPCVTTQYSAGGKNFWKCVHNVRNRKDSIFFFGSPHNFHAQNPRYIKETAACAIFLHRKRIPVYMGAAQHELMEATLVCEFPVSPFS